MIDDTGSKGPCQGFAGPCDKEGEKSRRHW